MTSKGRVAGTGGCLHPGISTPQCGRMRFTRDTLARLLLVVALLTGCAPSSTPDTSSPSSSSTSTTTSGNSNTLRVLVTNDDGIGARGIDELAGMLAEVDGVEISIWAPASNQSGTGNATTPTDVVVAESATRSGRSAHAVDGYPADAVLAAISQSGPFDVVVSGINAGANIGPSRLKSGTVGAARTAVMRGVWALAVSVARTRGAYGFRAMAPYVRSWIAEHRAAMVAGEPARLFSLNAPTCTTGTLGPVAIVPPAEDFRMLTFSPGECTDATGTSRPTDDVQAFVVGRPSLSELSVETLAGVSSSG